MVVKTLILLVAAFSLNFSVEASQNFQAQGLVTEISAIDHMVFQARKLYVPMSRTYKNPHTGKIRVSKFLC